MSVSMGSYYLEHTVFNGKNRDIESTSSQIKDKDILFSFLVETIGDGSSSRFIDDSDYIESRNDTSIFSG
jgi:hypothetical protein